MSKYNYPFFVDDETLKRLEFLDATEWIGIFKKVLHSKSIDYNIDFTDNDPFIQLKDLYGILVINNIDVLPFQQAVVQLLIEYYGDNLNNTDIFCLIQCIDYIKPARYFKYIENLITSFSFNRVSQFKADDGFSLHCHLINSIMAFDTQKTLYEYLSGMLTQKNVPEYYQVFLRYIYSYCTDSDFISFMNKALLYFDDPTTLSFVFYALEEYIFYKKGFTNIYLWLFDLVFLSDIKPQKEIMSQILNNLTILVNKNDYQSESVALYYPIKALICILKPQKLPISLVEKIIEKHEVRDFNKLSLMYQIGRNVNDIEVFSFNSPELQSEISFATLRGKRPIVIGPDHQAEGEYLKSGINKLKSEKIRINKTYKELIADSIIRKSLENRFDLFIQ
jgi:hypothetical protein